MSQSPENGSQHCKHNLRKGGKDVFQCFASQSPENGSQHCKRGPGLPGDGPEEEQVAIP